MPLSIDGVRLSQPTELPRASPTPAAHPAPPEHFNNLLRRLGRALDHGEATVTLSAHGYQQRDAAELIALQAGIYRYSEAVDLTAKLVDRAATAMKTVLESGR